MRARMTADRMTVGPALYRKVTLLALFALGFIVVTGARCG